ncbi:MAG TPA: S8 family serine peptidase, partial [Candidatus Thermoplasmatota archaeon]|nr:S8 family serine peptidase [Candidatus Thermoplasmatota archaeon]
LVAAAQSGVPEPGAATMAAQAQALFQAGVAVVVPDGPRSSLHASRHVLLVATDGCPGGAAGMKPDLTAPATARAATPSGPTAQAPVAEVEGSAVAAARVAGAAARMLQARPELPLAAVYDLLRDTASGDGACGGSLDVEAAVAAATAWQDPAAGGPEGSRESPAGQAAALLLLPFAAWAADRRRSRQRS